MDSPTPHPADPPGNAGNPKPVLEVSTESMADQTRRRNMVLAVLFVAVLIGGPIWFLLTTIYRAPLPYDTMNYYSSNILQHIDIKVPVYIRSMDSFKYPDLAEAAQALVDKELAKRDSEDPLIVRWGLELHQTGPDSDIPDDAYLLEIEASGDDRAGVYISDSERHAVLYYTLEEANAGQLPFYVMVTLLMHLFDSEVKLFQSSSQNSNSPALSYSPNYHLTFSLLYEDADPLQWRIDELLEQKFTPLRREMARFTNFTIDSQILYSSTLSAPPPRRAANGECFLSQASLATFINHADWSISGYKPYPTLNFILYVPAPPDSLLSSGCATITIEDSATNSFLIPQFGALKILNLGTEQQKDSNGALTVPDEKLAEALDEFTGYLFRLLGVPAHPKSPRIRVDAMTRFAIVQALKHASESLGSLARLCDFLPAIAVPSDVLAQVTASVALIEQSLQEVAAQHWAKALELAGQSYSRAEKGFFEKEMVQQAFFPQEHKLAVYMPLLGPVAVVMLSGLLRIIREHKLRKAESRGTPEEPLG